MNSFPNQSRQARLISNLHKQTIDGQLSWFPDAPDRILLANTDYWIPSCYAAMLSNKDKVYIYSIRHKVYDGNLDVYYPAESYQLAIIDTHIDLILFQSDYNENGLSALFNIVSTRYSGLESYFN